MSNLPFGLRCPECGKRITEEDSVCPNCGADPDAPLGEIERHTLSQEYLEKAQEAYDRARNLEEALEDAELAVQLEPESADAHNLRGLILDAMGKSADAIKSYREAIRLNPSLEDAIANLEEAEAEQPDEQQQAINSFSSQTEDPTPQASFEQSHREIRGFSGPEEDLRRKITLGLVNIGFLLGLIVGLGFLYNYGRDALSPKTTVTFEPDYSRISTVDSAILNQTAEIMTVRSQRLGYPKISFVVNESGQIVGKVPNYIDQAVFIERITRIGLLEFVEFGSTPLPNGAVIRTDIEGTTAQSPGEKQWHTVMTNNAIGTTTVVKDQMGRYQIGFSLTDDGTKTFADYTAAHVGKYLGIVLDKVIVSMPVIQQPITNGQGQISGSFTAEQANDLAAILRTTPLPIPIVPVR